MIKLFTIYFKLTSYNSKELLPVEVPPLGNGPRHDGGAGGGKGTLKFCRKIHRLNVFFRTWKKKKAYFELSTPIKRKCSYPIKLLPSPKAKA